jgi:hypothetical protein
VVFWAGARLYVLPKLETLQPQSVLLPILLLHALRHLGLMFLAPAATYPGIAPQFAYPAALGDLLAAVLAMAAIVAVARDVRGGRLLVWIFNVEGTLDLIAAIALETIYGAAASMGPAYWIPAFWVPALLVTHYITFIVPRKYCTGEGVRVDVTRTLVQLGIGSLLLVHDLLGTTIVNLPEIGMAGDRFQEAISVKDRVLPRLLAP